MKALSLFTGIGGLDLAAERCGIEPVAFCEIEPYAQKILRLRWPRVPIIEDVRDVTKEKIKEAMPDGSQGTIDVSTSNRRKTASSFSLPERWLRSTRCVLRAG